MAVGGAEGGIDGKPRAVQHVSQSHDAECRAAL